MLIVAYQQKDTLVSQCHEHCPPIVDANRPIVLHHLSERCMIPSLRVPVVQCLYVSADNACQ